MEKKQNLPDISSFYFPSTHFKWPKNVWYSFSYLDPSTEHLTGISVETKEETGAAANLFRELVEEMLEQADNLNPLLTDLLDIESIDWDELGENALESVFRWSMRPTGCG